MNFCSFSSNLLKQRSDRDTAGARFSLTSCWGRSAQDGRAWALSALGGYTEVLHMRRQLADFVSMRLERVPAL